MKIYIDYEFITWNKYILKERTNKFLAYKVKKEEEKVIKYFTIGKKYNGEYPIKITFKRYFKDKRQDLDGTNLKIIIDGLVKSGVIKNDNLNCIQEIIILPIFDKEKKGIEIEIEKI